MFSPEDHGDGTITVTARIRIQVPNLVDVRSRTLELGVDQDGRLISTDMGDSAAIARLVAFVIDQAPFEEVGLALLETSVSAPGGGAMGLPHRPRA